MTVVIKTSIKVFSSRMSILNIYLLCQNVECDSRNSRRCSCETFFNHLGLKNKENIKSISLQKRSPVEGVTDMVTCACNLH